MNRGRWLARWRIPVLLAAAAVCLGVGVTWPIMRATQFILFTRSFSILDVIRTLMSDGDWTLAGIILGFSIVVPLLKIGALAMAWLRLRQGVSPPPRLMAAVGTLGKWAMLDVFVLALVVFALKARSFGDATATPALYPFIAAVLLTAYCSHAISREARSL